MRHVYYVLAMAALAACGDDPLPDLQASAMPVSTVEDTPTSFEVQTNVPVSVLVTTAPEHGELTGEGTTWTYRPEDNYAGPDAVTLLATANGDTIELAIPITITPVNDAPIAAPDAFATNADIPVVIDGALLLANDSDVEGSALTLTTVANAASGGVVLTGDQITFTPALGFAGVATFEYTVTDGEASSNGVVDVSVGVDQAPIAVDDTAATTEDVALALTTAQLLGNDSDPDGHIITISAVDNCFKCTVVKTGSSITVTPAQDATGTATFEYTISDGALTDTGVVSIAITAVPDAPIANADAVTTVEDTPIQIAVGTLLGNDTDGDGDALAITSVTGATLAGGLVTFTPAADFTGDATFTYTVSDGTLTGTGTVTVTVTPVADAPLAVTDAITAPEDGSGSVDVLANDSDGDGDALSLVSFTQPGHGVVTVVGTVATYTPVADFTGADSFTYTVSDGTASTVGIVEVAVTPINDAPIAFDDLVPVVEETPTVIDALANDLDVDGDTLTFLAITQPAHGTAQLAGGIVTYTPAANYFGPDGFDYTVSDGNGGFDSGHVTLTVANVNDAPVAKADTLGTDENTAVSANVVANDIDADLDSLTVQSFTQPGHGTVSFAGPVATYTPATDFSGTDTFAYTITDGNGSTSTAAVTVFVGLDNDAPVAVDDTATVAEETATVISVLGNDSDIDGNPIEVTAVTAPEHGAISLVAGVITYTPADNYFGPDGFDYVINDGFGGSDIGHVAINVTNVNDLPVAANDALTTAEDTFQTINVTLNDTDLDGDTLEIASFTQPAHGTVVFIATDARYTPSLDYNGPDSFTYTVSDGDGGTATATISVTVTPVNDRPVAVDDSRTVVEETATAIAVLGNDNDVDGDTIAVTAVGTAAHGSVTLVAGAITYTPVLDYFGPDAFNYTISDGKGGTDVGRVTINVTNVNDAPVAVNDTLSTNEDTAKSLNVTANDSDVDNDALSIQSFTQPLGGTVTFTGNVATFTPALNFNGTTSFTYVVRDPSNTTATATVNITVIAVNDKPDAVNDAIATVEDTQSAALDLLGNDTDVDTGQTLTVTSNTVPPNGTVQRTGSVVRYTPKLNFNGTDSFTYTVSDGNGGTDTATVTVTVTAVNDPPDAVDDTIITDEDTQSASIDLLANDNDGDPEVAQTLAISTTTNPANGTLAVTGGSVRYTPNANFNGTDSFTYTISDGALTDTATVSITVTATNDEPVATDDAITTAEDTASASVNLLANDNDGDPELTQTLAITATTNPTNGSIVRTGGSVVYTPNANFNGSDSFTYTVSDGTLTDTATVNITVTAVNDPPVAADDTITTAEETASVSVDLLANDNDGDPELTQTLSITGNTNPTNGTLSFTGGSVIYTPNANFAGTDSFTYTLSDGALTDTATVTITVSPVNDPPVAATDAIATTEDTASALVNLLTNDNDGDPEATQTLSITGNTNPANGTLAFTGGSVRYTPNANFNGTDSFSYTLSDGALQATGTVNVTVAAQPDAPTAVADSFTVAAGSTTDFDVLVNDSDVDGEVVSLKAITVNPAAGTASINAGKIRYVVGANVSGTQTLTYQIEDPTNRLATAVVTITVTAANQRPTAEGTSESSDGGLVQILLTGSDPEATPLTFVILDAPDNGSLGAPSELDDTTAVVDFDPQGFVGTTSFTFKVIDGDGLESDPATVSITVSGCGDGVRQDDPDDPDASEECDDGNQIANDGCENDCKFTCGNSNQDAPLPDSVVVDPVTGHCFASYNETMDHDGALERCDTFFGHLATVTVSSENLAVLELLGSTPDKNGWIDGSDRISEGRYRFESGTFEQFPSPGFFAPGEGNNPEDDCIVGATNGWFDVSCNLELKTVVCEFNDRGVCGDGVVDAFEECDDENKDPGDGCENDCKFTCGSGDGGTLSLVHPETNHCYTGYDERVDFGAAATGCVDRGGHLMTVTDIDENEIALKIANTMASKGAWLGANDFEGDAIYEWLTEEPFEFNAFSASAQLTQPCVVVVTDQGWFDVQCDAPQTGTICEFELVPVTTAFHGEMFDNLAKYGTLGTPAR